MKNIIKIDVISFVGTMHCCVGTINLAHIKIVSTNFNNIARHSTRVVCVCVHACLMCNGCLRYSFISLMHSVRNDIQILHFNI